MFRCSGFRTGRSALFNVDIPIAKRLGSIIAVKGGDVEQHVQVFNITIHYSNHRA